MVVGTSPIGCAPKQRFQSTTNECNAEVNSLSKNYNQGLQSMLQDLKSELKDMHYSYLDTYSIFTNFIDNPTTYGTCNILRTYKSARTKRLYVHLFSRIFGLWLSNLRIVFFNRFQWDQGCLLWTREIEGQGSLHACFRILFE